MSLLDPGEMAKRLASLRPTEEGDLDRWWLCVQFVREIAALHDNPEYYPDDVKDILWTATRAAQVLLEAMDG